MHVKNEFMLAARTHSPLLFFKTRKSRRSHQRHLRHHGQFIPKIQSVSSKLKASPGTKHGRHYRSAVPLLTAAARSSSSFSCHDLTLLIKSFRSHAYVPTFFSGLSLLAVLQRLNTESATRKSFSPERARSKARKRQGRPIGSLLVTSILYCAQNLDCWVPFDCRWVIDNQIHCFFGPVSYV